MRIIYIYWSQKTGAPRAEIPETFMQPEVFLVKDPTGH